MWEYELRDIIGVHPTQFKIGKICLNLLTGKLFILEYLVCETMNHSGLFAHRTFLAVLNMAIINTNY